MLKAKSESSEKRENTLDSMRAGIIYIYSVFEVNELSSLRNEYIAYKSYQRNYSPAVLR